VQGLPNDGERARMTPPFMHGAVALQHGRLAALIVSADDAAAADALARDLGRTAPHCDGVDVLGPAPAPLVVLRGRHRRRLLLKTRRDVAVQPILREWLAQVAVTRGTRVGVDVDPVSFL
jgi:primosomal protein N' (replication factor Y) (superfamily II helicase)